MATDSSTPKIEVGSHIRELQAFLDESPTPYHAVNGMATMFAKEGFIELKMGDAWSLQKGKEYFIENNGSIIAFVLGTESLETNGCKIIAAHTDSPNLQIKPRAISDRSGYMNLNVEPYGGTLLASWVDRDLSIAGVVHYRDVLGVNSRLVKASRSTARISQLAIHLNRTVNETGLIVNPQSQLMPLIGMTNNEVTSQERFNKLLCALAGIQGGDILSYDLSLFDTQKSVIGGMEGEFIYSSRLDNLTSCYAATAALCNANYNVGDGTYIVACFNHEEVGSESMEGAESPFLKEVLKGILTSQGGGREEYRRTIAHSLCISSDMAHAINPNYPEKHDVGHAPVMNRGLVLKSNINQRYATTGVTAAKFLELCEEADVPCQQFVNRADLACGSTIGPMVASRLGIPTIDVGAGMLSMHSARECAGVKDILDMIKVYSLFFTR
jgi:aspartyl aminopeptidase